MIFSYFQIKVDKMDLSKLPSSCSKLSKIDKAAIEKDRRDFWEEFYKKVNIFNLSIEIFYAKCIISFSSMNRLQKQTLKKKKFKT